MPAPATAGGGDPLLLYETFAGCLARLPDSDALFPGHEYLLRNLDFTLDREPSNQAARDMLQRCSKLSAEAMPVTTLGEEATLQQFSSGSTSPGLIARAAAASVPTAGQADAARGVPRLRELRNSW
jgi:hydroxyacylglutathione hydrolase